MKVLVTGASGFVGGALVAGLSDDAAFRVRAASRRPALDLPQRVEHVRVDGLGEETDWSHALAGCDAVVHSAARVHVVREHAADPLAEFRRTNVAGTVTLATQAARLGVRRFVFLSSVKVSGERTEPGQPYRVDDPPAPVDAYGVSKREAEDGLRRVADATGMEVVIVRPVLVYGPGVKANFETMLRWLHRGIPLPFGATRNRRSLVSVDNLVDLLTVCLTHPAAVGRTFFASDDDDISTTELLRRSARALGRRARLVPVPPRLLRMAAAAVGKGGAAVRLCDSLQVDVSETRRVLGWSPPVSMEDTLARTATAFLARERH